jgi:hypothetical protein
MLPDLKVICDSPLEFVSTTGQVLGDVGQANWPPVALNLTEAPCTTANPASKTVAVTVAKSVLSDCTCTLLAANEMKAGGADGGCNVVVALVVVVVVVVAVVVVSSAVVPVVVVAASSSSPSGPGPHDIKRPERQMTRINTSP